MIRFEGLRAPGRFAMAVEKGRGSRPRMAVKQVMVTGRDPDGGAFHDRFADGQSLVPEVVEIGDHEQAVHDGHAAMLR